MATSIDTVPGEPQCRAVGLPWIIVTEIADTLRRRYLYHAFLHGRSRAFLNPVLVVISLVFWFWMWGIPGGILSMPMLAITKIICDRLQPLAAFGHFLEG
jgi:predicted PurR-regulated permease PerM